MLTGGMAFHVVNDPGFPILFLSHEWPQAYGLCWSVYFPGSRMSGGRNTVEEHKGAHLLYLEEGSGYFHIMSVLSCHMATPNHKGDWGI